MIFATDHEAGNRIMSALYNSAANEFPAMRQAAGQRRARLAEEAAGVQSLFRPDDLDSKPVAGRETLYQYSPPSPPFGTSDQA